MSKQVSVPTKNDLNGTGAILVVLALVIALVFSYLTGANLFQIFEPTFRWNDTLVKAGMALASWIILFLALRSGQKTRVLSAKKKD